MDWKHDRPEMPWWLRSYGNVRGVFIEAFWLLMLPLQFVFEHVLFRPIWWIADNVIPPWVIALLNETFLWRGIVLALVIDRWVL